MGVEETLDLLIGVCLSKETLKKGRELYEGGHVIAVGESGDMIWAEVKGKSGEDVHTPSIKVDGTWSCGCEAGAFGADKFMCSHQVANILAHGDLAQPYLQAVLARKLSGNKEEEKVKPATIAPSLFRFLSTGLKAWDELVGGLPLGGLTGIFGPHQAGKTIAVEQFAFQCMKELGGNALVVDTEGSGFNYTLWAPVLAKRYGVEADLVGLAVDENGEVEIPKLDRNKRYVIICDAREIEKILAFHGKAVELEIKEAKISVLPKKDGWKTKVEESQIYKLLKECNIKYLAYDSITNPLLEFGSERQNFPARANCTSIWLIQAEKLAERLRIPVVCTIHETIDPANPFPEPRHSGGAIVGYTFKFVTYLTHIPVKGLIKFPKDPPAGLRAISLERHPIKPPWGEVKYLQLTSEGYKDLEG